MALSLDPKLSALNGVSFGGEPIGIDQAKALLEPDAPRRTPISQRRRGPAQLTGWLIPAVAAVLFSASFFAPNTASAQVKTPQENTIRASTPIQQALARLLAANKNGDQLVVGRGYYDELTGIDSTARAVYEYVNYMKGDDYLEGGLGMGYSLRPKHMTGNHHLTIDDLKTGVAALELRLSRPAENDQVAKDLAEIMAAGGISYGAVYTAAESLLDQSVKLTGAKEIATRKETALLSEAELQAGLAAGSLELRIASVASGHGPVVLADWVKWVGERSRAFGMKPRVEDGVIGDAQQKYLLMIAKRARELDLLDQIRGATATDQR